MRKRRGGVFVVVAAGLTALAAAGALAVDMGMGVLERARLQNAADAAALAASYHLAPTLDAPAARAAAVDWGARNGAAIRPQDVLVGRRPDGKAYVEVKASKDVPTAFARMFGTQLLAVGARSAVALGAPGMPDKVLPFAVPAVEGPGGSWQVMTDEDKYEPLEDGSGHGCGGRKPVIRLKCGKPVSQGAPAAAGNGSFQPIAVDGCGDRAFEAAVIDGVQRKLAFGTRVELEHDDMDRVIANAVRKRLARAVDGADEAYVPLVDAAEWATRDRRRDLKVVGAIRVRLMPPDRDGEVISEFLEGVVGLPGSLTGVNRVPGTFVPILVPPGQLTTASL